MIPYSVSLRANPQKPTEAKKAYATAQSTEVIDLTEFSKHVHSHGSKYNRADIYAVLAQSVDCMRELLLDGKRIDLGELGTFFISLESKGADTLAAFTADNIKAVKVNWRPGEQFTDLLDDAEFICVATREAAEKLIKAQKAGQTSVDLSSSTSSSDSSDDSSSSGNSGNSGSDDSGSVGM